MTSSSMSCTPTGRPWWSGPLTNSHDCRLTCQMFTPRPSYLAVEVMERSVNPNLLRVVPAEHQLEVARSLYAANPHGTIKALITNGQLTTLRALVDERQPELTRDYLLAALDAGSVEAVSYLLLNDVPLQHDDLGPAAGSGSRELVEYLIRLGLHPTHSAISRAARRGQLSTVQYLVELGVEPTVENLFDGVVGGRVEVLGYLFRVLVHAGILDDSEYPGKLDVPESAYETAIEHGHLAALQWLFAHDARGLSVQEYCREMKEDRVDTLYDVAYGSGQMAVADWLVAQGVPPNVESMALVYAFESTNCEVILELFDQHFEWVMDVILEKIDEYVEQLVEHKCFEVLTLLNERSGYEYITGTILRAVAEQGDPAVIQWAGDHLKYVNDYDLHAAATWVNNVPALMKMLELLRAQGAREPDLEEIARGAAGSGNQVLLRYLLEQGPLLAAQATPGAGLGSPANQESSRLAPTINRGRVARSALIGGHYALVEELHLLDPTQLPDLVKGNREILDDAIINDFVHTLDYLRRNGVAIPNDAIQRALQHGSLRVVIYLLRHGHRFTAWLPTPVIDLVPLLYQQLGLPPTQVVRRFIELNNLYAIDFLAGHDYSFQPYLMDLVNSDRLDALRILYRRGYRVTTRMLEVARRRGYHQLARFLEAHGVGVDPDHQP